MLRLLPWLALSLPLSTKVVAKLNVSIVAVGSVDREVFPSFVYVGPPLSVAIEHVKQKYKDIMNFKINFLYSTTRTGYSEFADDANWMVSQWHYRNRSESDLTVYLLPSNPATTQIPSLQAQWNTLWITTLSATPQIRNRKVNPTWIATNLFSQPLCSDLYVELLAKYGWTSVYCVIDKSSDPFYKNFGGLVIQALKKANVKPLVNEIETKPFRPFGKFVPILEQARTVSRVVLFFGHAKYLRELVLTAASMNMTNGEYVYIATESMHHNDKMIGLLDWQYNDTDDPVAFQAYQSVLVVHPRDIDKPPNEHLAPQFMARSQTDYNYTYPMSVQPVYIFLADTYNAVTALGQVLHEAITSEEAFNYQNGTAIAERFFNRTFPDESGGSGMYIDNSGMRRTDFTITYFTANGTREPLMHKIGMTGALEEVVQLKTWVNASFPPPNEPLCGYHHQKEICRPQREKTAVSIIITGLVGILLITGSVALGCLRYIRRKAEERLLLSPWWHVILTSVSGITSWKSQQSSFFSGMSRKKLDSISAYTKQPHAVVTTGAYEGKQVMIRNICCRNYPATFRHLSAHHGFLQIMKMFYRIEHQNLCQFFGLSITVSDTCTISAVFERPCRGSLLDVCNTFITKDFSFASSLIVDYLDAVQFVHACPFRYHGRISISACWIDKHFTLKLTNLAINRLTQELCRTSEHFQECAQPTVTESLYWLTPEAPDSSNVKGMQAVDMFSSAFIIYEILTKASLHSQIQLKEPEEMVSFVLRKNTNPYLETAVFANLREFEPLLRSCWNTDPTQRPSIRRFRAHIEKISPMLSAGSKRSNVVDELYKRLSHYSADLEHEVTIRTITLREEMEKCDAITAQFLPRAIVRRMRTGQGVDAEIFESVSLMFTDLFGFADFVKSHTPEVTISLIGDAEAWFDTLSTKCEVYKVEAVGDSYLVASGLPIRIGQDHTLRIANFALMLMAAEAGLTFLKNMRFKIGIHSGSCAAGVLGLRRPRYCLFGDTVNTASRMCSLALPGRIHISSDFKLLLERMPEFTVELRGSVPIKGKATMTTYWLVGRAM